MAKKLQLGVLASGSGSNLQAIMDAIEGGRLDAEIKLVISDKEQAYALERAKGKNIPALYIDPKESGGREAYNVCLAQTLREAGVDTVVLAGFMRIVTKALIGEFPNRILNIHPALLPSFPGLHAQQQAVDYGVRWSGCTVHFVDEGMDTGPIIAQAVVPVEGEDTEETLGARILKEEHRIYSESLQLLAEGRLQIEGRKVILLPPSKK